MLCYLIYLLSVVWVLPCALFWRHVPCSHHAPWLRAILPPMHLGAQVRALTAMNGSHFPKERERDRGGKWCGKPSFNRSPLEGNGALPFGNTLGPKSRKQAAWYAKCLYADAQRTRCRNDEVDFKLTACHGFVWIGPPPLPLGSVHIFLRHGSRIGGRWDADRICTDPPNVNGALAGASSWSVRFHRVPFFRSSATSSSAQIHHTCHAFNAKPRHAGMVYVFMQPRINFKRYISAVLQRENRRGHCTGFAASIRHNKHCGSNGRNNAILHRIWRWFIWAVFQMFCSILFTKRRELYAVGYLYFCEERRHCADVHAFLDSKRQPYLRVATRWKWLPVVETPPMAEKPRCECVHMCSCVNITSGCHATEIMWPCLDAERLVRPAIWHRLQVNGSLANCVSFCVLSGIGLPIHDAGNRINLQLHGLLLTYIVCIDGCRLICCQPKSQFGDVYG